MTVEEADKTLKVFVSCFVLEGGCIECPLNKDNKGDCMGEGKDMIIGALKRLKLLETPTKKEQPELPIDFA